MDILQVISQNLLTPAVLFFILGITAGFFKSDLEIPNSISRYLSIYLMMAIGFKGGVAIANTTVFGTDVIGAIFAGVAIGFLQPFIGYFLLKRTTKLDSATAAAVAAHYGSISMVTFATAAAFLKVNEVVYAGYIVAILALMEAPAILAGLFIAHKADPKTKHENEEKKLAKEIFTNGAILLLFGSFLIGWITGQSGMNKMEGFLVTPFQGILALFLLDMGLLVAKNIHHLKNFTLPLALFGIYMPLIGSCVGLGTSYMLGLDVGTGTLFTVLCASASYIAVPAAMRLALPEAKAAIYIPMSLAITFPFNVVLGIPLYYTLAGKIL
ncbi:MAG TPA: sodium-dependent bicarbonate transport family permease [Alphaproteobacteria bacterium]|nr:sodium-dependent bicarbonate transport family permease [Alphaproteobacteria bacterium]